MSRLKTKDIMIEVETLFLPKQSLPYSSYLFFAYKITLHNFGSNIIQLLRRHWDIYDFEGGKRVVDGDGVVGILPVIHPNESYTYTSGCNLIGEFGNMSGYYTFINLDNHKIFSVDVPEFTLMVPYLNN